MRLEIPGTRLGFNELLLTAVMILMVAGVGLGIALYVLPGEHLEIPELEPAVRVARVEDLPVGASRLIRWGGPGHPGRAGEHRPLLRTSGHGEQ